MTTQTVNVAHDPQVTALVAAAFQALTEASDRMLEASGGECGRDFTPSEKEAFDSILSARAALKTADPWGVWDRERAAVGMRRIVSGLG